MVNCSGAAAQCYGAPNITGFDGLLNYTSSNLGSASADLPFGQLGMGLMIFLPMWLIIFLILAKYDSKSAFVVSSFVMWIISVPLVIMGYLNNTVSWMMLVAVAAGLVIVYMRDRGG